MIVLGAQRRGVDPATFLRLLSYAMGNTYNTMKRVVASISMLCCLASCGNSERAVVHQGWEARYRYNQENRRLHPYYHQRRVGKSIGRDERGKVDYKRWWRNQVITEDLLKKPRR